MKIPILPNSRPGVALGCASLIVVGGLALVANLPGYRPSDFLRRHLEGELSTLGDDELLPQMRRIVELGDEGVVTVVQRLASKRESEAEAAQLALAEAVDRWRLMPRAESAPRVIGLARALGESTEPLPPSSRRFLGDLAGQLLLWPVEDSSQAEELVEWCEAALSRASPTAPGAQEIYAIEQREIPPLPSPARRAVLAPGGNADPALRR